MRHVRLIATLDEYDTSLGFKIKGTPAFDSFMACRDGLLTAHDLLEHQNGFKNMGPVWDELEALGGIWQVRGRWGEMLTERYSAFSAAASVASDIVRMFREYECDPDTGPGGLSVGSKPHLHDEDFTEILEIARNDIPKEYNDGDEFDADLLAEYLKLALHRMRAGFRKAEKRFGNRFIGHSLFAEIRDAVKAAVTQLDYEGQEFRLSYDFENGATCNEIFEGYDND